MESNLRREKIIKLLSGGKSFTATQLAERFGVTRQIIVSDIARLRSAGNEIFAGKRGYSMPDREFTEVFSCRHSPSRLKDELYAVVDNGGTVIDEIIEHPVYGSLRAIINISSRHDADMLLAGLRDNRASQLSELSGGQHRHTVKAGDAETLARIKERLSALGLLARENRETASAPAWLF